MFIAQYLFDGNWKGELLKDELNGSGKLGATPCAACKFLRRRCAEKCFLSPYFPPDNAQQFAAVHRVFRESNIVQMLEDLPADRKVDAVTCMVYEANARLRDPVYGCAGIVYKLQHQISHLQSQLAGAQAEIFNLRLHQSNLISVFSQTGIDPHNNDINAGDMEELFLHDR